MNNSKTETLFNVYLICRLLLIKLKQKSLRLTKAFLNLNKQDSYATVTFLAV